jgi:ribosome biogenesis GTPase
VADEATALPAGTVVATGGGVYEVRLASGAVVSASLRGRLKQEQRTGDRVVTGDRVGILKHDDGSHTIETVHERTSELARQAPGTGGRRAKIIVANIDHVFVVFAAAQPAPHFRMLDRFLVLAEANSLRATIVINKVDLVNDIAALDALLAPYTEAGYDVLCTSVKTGTGVAELSERLRAHESVLAGPSGAGKSSLLNQVQPGLGLLVGAVSDATNKGRHTTTRARLLPLDAGGYVADTPGLREIGLWDVDPQQLPHCFPEFALHIEHCRFADCTHTHEPGCAVRAAVQDGAVSRARYESYVAMRAGFAAA